MIHHFLSFALTLSPFQKNFKMAEKNDISCAWKKNENILKSSYKSFMKQSRLRWIFFYFLVL